MVDNGQTGQTAGRTVMNKHGQTDVSDMVEHGQMHKFVSNMGTEHKL